MPTDSKASAFTIRELTGRKRTVRLTGRALPYRGVPFPGTMRVEVTWNPGNPEGSAQVLGSTTDPTAAKGFWKDRFLRSFTSDGVPVQPDGAAELNDAPLNTALDIVFVFESLRDEGQLLEVTWDRIIRRGFLTKFVPTVHLVSDIEWEMDFTWISKGDAPVPAVYMGTADMVGLRATWATHKVELIAAAKPKFPAFSAFLSTVQSLVGKVTDGADQIEQTIAHGVDTVTNVLDSALQQVDTARRLIGVLSYIVTTANDLLTTVQDRTAVSLLRVQDAATAPYGLVVSAASYQSGLGARARTIKNDAASQQQQLAKNADSNVQAVHTARAGQDLRDVSTRYYNTPNEWRRLQRFNGLSDSGLSAGQVVYVPRLQQGWV